MFKAVELITFFSSPDCDLPTVNIAYQSTLENPTIIEYSSDYVINIQTALNCTCSIFWTKKWIINSIDSVGNVPNQTMQSINSTDSFLSVTINNETLNYGLYRFVYEFQIITDNRYSFLTVNTTFFRIIPNRFKVLAFDNRTIQLSNRLVIGQNEHLSFLPAYYSYNPDYYIDPNSLSYDFYCILTDFNAVINKSALINNTLYLIRPNATLSQEELNSPDTCFKSTGK